MKISDVHKIAILLDPKKRSLKMMKNATEKEYMKQLLFSEMKKYDSDENSQIQSLTSSKKRKYKTLSDKYNDDSDTEEEDIYDQSKSKIEFEKYFKSKFNIKETDILKFWSNKSNDFPVLYKVVKKICIPATEFESERNFSITGWICDSRRSRLNSEHIDQLVFVKNHLKL
jgi:hypothetical protein